jgi:flotillin
VIDAQSARADAELKVQQARIEQVRLKLEADLIQPALAYRSQRQAQAKAAVARIKEGGQATARGMRQLSAAWLQAGGDAREIFLLEKLRTLVGIMVGTVRNVHVDQITVVGDSTGQDTTAGKVASLMEQLKSGADIDVPALLKRLAIGVKASQPPNS